ncbi:MAG: hypothetical protein SVR08_10190 [Spirochaetota bacterium]|nr:hypothetical protein [Spirochaetota bacterium]
MKNFVILLMIFVFVNNAYAITTSNVSSNSDKEKVAFYDFITIGMGLPGISYKLKKGIDNQERWGVFDTVSPLTLSFSPKMFQGVIKQSENPDNYWRYSYWTFSIGFLINKSGEEPLKIGASLVPMAVRLHNFAIGIGLAYIHSDDDTLSIIMPITYNL